MEIFNKSQQHQKIPFFYLLLTVLKLNKLKNLTKKIIN